MNTENIKRDIKFRVYLAFMGICLFGVAIVIKAAMIQVKEGPRLKALSRELKTRYRTDTLYAERGNIYTEDGLLLSTSIPEFDVAIDFSVIQPDTFTKYIDTLSYKLSRFFGDRSPEQYKLQFTAAYEREDQYEMLGRKLTYEQFELLRTFPIFNKGKGSGGFISTRSEKRSAPYKNLASHTIGIFRGANSTGLEGYYDTILSGVNGSREAQKSTGVWLPVEGSEVEPRNGRDIVSTLDMNIQDVAEDALLNVLQQENCSYGTCIVMEVKTGKIRALANLGKIDSMKGKPVDDIYRESYNYALIPTEPGSTFKLVTLLSLLQDKYVTVDTKVDAQGGAIKFGNQSMKDSHLGLGEMPVWMAFAKSSNAAMSKLANKHYRNNPKKFVKHLYDLRLNQPTGIDLLGKFPTRMRNVDSNWSATSLPWMAIGYEVAVSPLHTCMIYNAVANNGTMMKPYLVSSIKEYGKDIRKIEPTVLVKKIADSSTIAQLRQCLRSVVTSGTAKGIESPYYTMCGKTGTAQVADRNIKYSDGVYQGSFVGYFPAEDPKYTICVVIRTKPHSNNYYGGAIAAPVFRMVADKIFSNSMGAWGGPLDSLARLGGGNHFSAKWATGSNYRTLLHALQRPDVKVSDYSDALMQLSADSAHHLSIAPARVFRNIMPDLKGMGLKDAIYMLESCGLQVTVKGKGRVLAQSIEPGRRIIKGQPIILQLS